MGKLIEELKRRNVFRVGGAYVVSAWLVLQVGSIIAPILELPTIIMRGLLFVLVAGFFLSVLLAWVYELKAGQITLDDGSSESPEVMTPSVRLKIDYYIIAVLGLAVVALLADRFVFSASRFDPADGKPSIAVLAFESMSDDPDDGYFSDGISEEILNLLAHVEGLRVSARTSSFQFKGVNRDIREIGELLDVRTVLEGSVRRSGEKLRVTAQLIDASNGYHLWSDTFDSEVEDVFEVQDRIAGEIARTLEVKLLRSHGDREFRHEPSLDNYQKYLVARHLAWDRSQHGLGQARQLLEDIIADDPDYAEAIASLAMTVLYQRGRRFGELTYVEATSRAAELTERALSLNPELAEGYEALGLLEMTARNDDAAMEAFDQAISLKPSSSEALYLRSFMYGRKGRHAEGLADMEEAARINPASWKIAGVLASRYLAHENFKAVFDQLDRVEQLGGGSEVSPNGMRAAAAFASGQWAEAWRYGQEIPFEQTNSLFGVKGRILPRVILGKMEDPYGDGGSYINENQRLRVVMMLAGGFGDYERARTEFESAPSSMRERIGFRSSLVGAAYEAGDRNSYIESAYNFLVEVEQVASGSDFMSPYLTASFALACEEAGNKTCIANVIEGLSQAIDGLREAEVTLDLPSLEACLAVLESRPDDVLHWLGVLVARKSIAPFELESRAFELVWDNPNYQALRRELYDHMNAERAKLGWAPVEMPDLYGKRG